MKKTNIKVLGIVLFIITILLSLVWLNKDKSNKDQTVVRIACNLPLTGGLATYGTSIKDGASFAIEEILKKDSSIFFQVDFQDNGGLPKSAVDIFIKQKLQTPDIYVSGVKPQTMSIIDNVEKLNIPHFTWVFDAFVTEKYKNVFRTWVNYKMEPKSYLEYIDNMKPRSIAIAYVDLPHTDEEFNQIILPALKKRGISVNIEKYSIEKSDFRDIALKFKSYSPDLMMINGFKSNLIPLVKNFREYNLFTPNNSLFTFDLLDASEDLSIEMLEGLHVVVPKYETINDKNLNWKREFLKRFGRKPRYTDAYSYDMIQFIYNTIKINGKVDLTHKLINTKFEGITGDFKFDASGDLILQLEVMKFSNGKMVK